MSNIDLAGIAIKSYLYLGAVRNGAIKYHLAGMAKESAAHKPSAVRQSPLPRRESSTQQMQLRRNR